MGTGGQDPVGLRLLRQAFPRFDKLQPGHRNRGRKGHPRPLPPLRRFSVPGLLRGIHARSIKRHTGKEGRTLVGDTKDCGGEEATLHTPGERRQAPKIINAGRQHSTVHILLLHGKMAGNE